MIDDQIKQLISKLQRIAKKNDDEFTYFIEIFPKSDGIYYIFIAKETADNHLFASGSGATIEKAVVAAYRDIEIACENWSYKL